jgi:hydroxylysine kinase
MAPQAIFGVRSLQPIVTPMDEQEAAELVERTWGVSASATRLAAEVDENFRMHSAAGEYLLKVVPADEPAELTDLVTQAMLYVDARATDVHVQEVVRTADGEPVIEFVRRSGEARRARFSTFIEGTMLRAAKVVPALREQLGASLAKLARVLEGFDHPSADRELSWDLRHAWRMTSMLDELEPTESRDDLRDALDEFEASVVPVLKTLPRQIVHNDLSSDNVVVRDQGGLGILDFGDIVRTQRVNDVAIAMSDCLEDSADPILQSLDLLRGYVSVTPLSEEELSVVYDLVRTRAVTRVVSGEWRAMRFPENHEYLTRNVERMNRVLENLPRRPTASTSAKLDAIIAGVRR